MSPRGRPKLRRCRCGRGRAVPKARPDAIRALKVALETEEFATTECCKRFYGVETSSGTFRLR